MTEIAVPEPPKNSKTGIRSWFRRSHQSQNEKGSHGQDTEILPLTGEERITLLDKMKQDLSDDPRAFNQTDFSNGLVNLIGGTLNDREHASEKRTTTLTEMRSKSTTPDGRIITVWSQDGGTYGRQNKITITSGERTEILDGGYYKTYDTSDSPQPGIYTDLVAGATKVAGRDAGQIAPGEPFIQTESDTSGNSYTTHKKSLSPTEAQEFCRRVFNSYTSEPLPALPPTPHSISPKL